MMAKILMFLVNFHGVAAMATMDTPSSCIATTETLSSKLSPCANPVPTSNEKNATATWELYVNDFVSGERQTIEGFGATFTDAAVISFDALPVEKQDEVAQNLFSKDGISLNLMRHTIGQSDLTPSSIGSWSYDMSDTPDPNLTKFNLTVAGLDMINWLNKMNSVNPDVFLFGSIWSPPKWMKNNNNLNWIHVDSWVNYIVRYLNEFKKRGVLVDAITMQNEPLHDYDPNWTMVMDASYQAILANKLIPAFRSANLNVDLLAYDHNTDRPDYPQYVVDNSNVSSVAWHCYSTAGRWEALSQFQHKYPHVKQYMTECWTHVDTGEGFFDLPGFVGGPLKNFAVGAMAWTVGGADDYQVATSDGCTQCSGLIQVNRTSHTFEFTQDYFTMGQYSKFVERGAVVLATTGTFDYPDGTGVDANAFRNPDGKRVVVIQNKIKNALNVQIHFKTDSWVGEVPARSVVTWVLP